MHQPANDFRAIHKTPVQNAKTSAYSASKFPEFKRFRLGLRSSS
jgi:hypothetical protein